MDYYLISLFIAIGFLSFRRGKVNITGYISIIVFSSVLILTNNYGLLAGITAMFVSSAIITSVKQRRYANDNKSTSDDKPRNWKQSVANVGVPSVLALVHTLYPVDVFIFMSFCSLACASADTWSSEIGVLSKSKPVFLVSRALTEKGVSGGVTSLGTAASIMGSVVIAGIYFMFHDNLMHALLVGAIGFLGSVLDSVIGELFQAKYIGGNSEITDDKNAGELVSGLRIISNNKVNFIAVTLSALLAFVIQYLLLQD
jgi:uncharacterized protein (TIGR00297 family)